MDPTQRKLDAWVHTRINKLYKDSISYEGLPADMIAVIKDFDPDICSHRRRITSELHQLYYNHVFDRVGTIVCALRATRTSDPPVSTLFGMIYGHLDDDGINIVHDYAGSGPTYSSQDGEFRSRIIRWTQLDAFFEKYAYVTNIIEELVVEKLDAEELSFEYEFFYPDSVKHGRGKFEASVNEMRMPVKLFTLAWLYDYYNIHNHIEENHMNDAYKRVIYNDGEDIEVLEQVLDKLDVQFYIMTTQLSTYYHRINMQRTTRSTHCGTKLHLLTALEIVSQGNILFETWREIYISQKLSDLVLNFVMAGAPFHVGWFYVHGVHPGLFDNKAMHDKFIHSSIAAGMSNQLRDIDRSNYIDRRREKGTISSKFHRVSSNLQKAIVYTDANLRLTSLAVCTVSEYAGRTWMDIPILSAGADKTDTHAGLSVTLGKTGGQDISSPTANIKSGIKSNGKNAARLSAKGLPYNPLEGNLRRYVWDLMYTLHCVSTRMGIIHGDLHLNNITINQLYDLKKVKMSWSSNIAVFVVDGVCYQFPHYGAYSTIIDFSRAIICDREMIVADFGEIFADQFFFEQNNRVVQLIHKYYPKLAADKEYEILAVMKTRPIDIYRLLPAIDMMVVSTNIHTMLVDRGMPVHPSNIKLLTQISTSADNLFREGLASVLRGQSTTDRPTSVIIREVFAGDVCTVERISRERTTVRDYFNSTAPLKWSLYDPERVSPLLSTEEYDAKRAELGMPIAEGRDRWKSHQKLADLVADQENVLITPYKDAEAEVIGFMSTVPD